MTDVQIETAKKEPAKKSVKKSAKKTAAKKSTKKPVAVSKKAGVSAKGPGVIATIVETISREKGASAAECLEVLKKAFPDRNPDGMIKTIRIQAARNATSKERVEERGLVYFKRR
jgi:hypothetical protein